jgi:hypothetical protein
MDIFLSDSMRPTVCLSYLSVFLSFFLSYCLSICLYCCLSVFLSLLSVCLFLCLSNFLSFCRSVCLSVCLFFAFLFFHRGIWRTMHCRLCMKIVTELACGRGGRSRPPPPPWGLIKAKTTVHCSPGSSMFLYICLAVWLSIYRPDLLPVSFIFCLMVFF